VSDGLEIGTSLIRELGKHGGIGLAANQLGINSSVCVIHVRKDGLPKVLVNPKIVSRSDELVTYIEGCLSLPKKLIKTIRNKSITIVCDNFENEIIFQPDSDTLTNENYLEDLGLLECVCAQHEIGHLNGELITDPKIRFPKNPKVSTKINRNDMVMIQKGDDTQMVKYKKSENLIKDGWKII